MLGFPDLEVEKISSSTYGWKRILVALNGEFSEPKQLKLPPQTTFATFLERSSALHELGRFSERYVYTCGGPNPGGRRCTELIATDVTQYREPVRQMQLESPCGCSGARKTSVFGQWRGSI